MPSPNSDRSARTTARDPWGASAPLLLYAITLLLEVPGYFVRGILVYIVCWLVLTLLGVGTGIAWTVALVVAVFPLAWSVLALVSPVGDAWLWQAREGGRSPSRRETDIYYDALHSLIDAHPEVRPPRHWFVVDRDTPNASAMGDTVMINRGLFDSPYFRSVLAHELGHLAGLEGRLSAALNRLLLWPDPLGPNPGPGARPFRALARGLLYLAGGGLSLRILRAAWAVWWREREFAADRYAARLGEGPGQAAFLEQEALSGDFPVPFLWLSDKGHPYTEHRIDRLRETIDSSSQRASIDTRD